MARRCLGPDAQGVRRIWRDPTGRFHARRSIFKSVAFAIVLGCFKILEEICIGLFHGKSAGQSIQEVAGGTLNGILAMIAILAVLLVPFFAFTELRRIFGKEKLAGLFFTSGHLPAESS